MAMIACSQQNVCLSSVYFDALSSAYAKSYMDMNVCNHKGYSALYLASKAGDEYAVSVLLNCKADPNQAVGPNREPPLFAAVRGAFLPVVETLINRGAYVNAKNDEGTTALHLAILTKKYPVIKLLLEHGAYVGVADKYGRTPLHCAIQCSKSMINASMRVERLLLEKGADINATDILGRTPLHIAFIDFDVIPHMNTLRDTFKNVKKLVKSRKQAAEMDKEAEKSVSMYGHPKSMATNQWIREAVIAKHKRLQRRRASSSSEEDDLRLLSTQELALLETYAEMKSEIDYPLARKSDPIAIINFLLRYPVLECDKADRFGRTPLHYAAATGAFSCSSMLCSRGVVVERLDNDMNMPLQLSLLYKHVDYSIMLCNNGVVPSNVMQLPSGEAVSTFKYSLSQGFLNMAFLILDRNQNILELLRDALTTGVFHVADILMNETNYTFLKESLADTNQNLWHVLADFTPFDREIWSEYLFDFMEKALHLSVVPETDSRGRSPIHYAAKHGQDALLKQLLRMGVTINKLDEDGIAELWYAVYSGHVSTVKILLEAGADVMQGTASDKKESILLMATESGNAEMVTLLLSAHAPTDDDSRYGRSTALMSACTKNSNLILQALLQSGADPNVPSWVATKHEGNEVFVLVHPILFAAGDTLKLLLEAGANVNVIGPKVKPWEGRSCFMACQDRDDLMMMLNYSVDVNLIDDYSRRTIFYQHLFASCIKKVQKDVLDRMFNSTAPTVNELDPDTGMTPLEYAIRNCSSDYVSHLLRLGADPNVESSGESADRCSIAGLYSKEPQNAVFHAIAHNDLGILREICTHSLYPINWFAVDSKQRTAIMFLLSEYSHENQEMLEFIASAMGEDFGAIVELVDSEGNRALDYARMRQRENLSNVLVKYGAPVPVDIPMIENESVNPMDTDDDFISMQAVEMDADEERENLEKEAAAKKRMESDTKLKDAQEKKGKSNGVDPLSKLEKIGVLLMDDDDRPYDIMIQKIDVGNGPYGTALFYKLSIIYNTVLDVYVLWTRWGAFGEDGMHQKTPYLIKDEAVAEFCSIFRSKTGNIWGTKFVTKPGRYELIRALPKRKQEILKEFSFFSASAKSELHPSLSNAMHLFCNLEALQNAYKNLQLDIPVGHIPQRLIDEGYRIMKKIKKSAEIWLQLHQQIYSKEVRAKKKEITHELIQLSNEYFKLFPPVNLKRGIQPLILSAKISAEYARLHNIGYFSFASNVILAAKRRVQEVHPLDYCYRALHCRLGVISADSVEYRMVDAYMNSTVRQGKYEIAHLFSVDRSGEAERFASIPSPKTNRMLLWHGSHIHNFLGIMKQGLRVTPSTSLQQTGSMFGQGIYFADTFTKSINYSTRNAGDANCPGYAMILLCDVALGNICEMGYYNATKFANSTYHSVKARGREGPSKQNALFDKDGVEIPMGPTVTYDFTGLDYIEQPRLSYNEYVVYDESRVKIRYVAVIRDRECCTLCQKMTSEEMRPLAGQKIGKEPVCYNLGAFEAKMLSFYVSRHDVDLQHLFDAKLDAYLKSEHYKTIASPPLPLNKSSEVCKECVDTIATSILIEEASSALPSDVQERPICRYGSDCRTKNDHIHAKKYQHWLHPNSAKAPQYQNDAKVDNMDGSDDDNDDDDSEEDN
ncbi:poly polymerase catalytic domain-containing protein [Dichotomocladium elegans]|nr:poly polymerase catalytic domain-containing protein [Dichotomocladium elegans]